MEQTVHFHAPLSLCSQLTPTPRHEFSLQSLVEASPVGREAQLSTTWVEYPAPRISRSSSAFSHEITVDGGHRERSGGEVGACQGVCVEVGLWANGQEGSVGGFSAGGHVCGVRACLNSCGGLYVLGRGP